MSVQAKFYVSNIEHHDGATADVVHLGAVCRGRENSEWASATPAGNITMHVRNDAAVAYFEQGEEYLVTFVKVAKPKFGDGHQPIPAPYHADHPASICKFCAVQAFVNPDTGELDWWYHDKLYVEGVNPAAEEWQAYLAEHGLEWASAWAWKVGEASKS